MKKNKTIAYLIAATLLVTGTFVGTKALFTDKIDVAGELKISTGDVDIEVVGTNDWKLNRNGNEHYDGTRSVIEDIGTTEGTLPDGGDAVDLGISPLANNLKPGDILSKTITIKNTGTLIANVTLGNNFIDIDNETNKLGVLTGLVTPSQSVKINKFVDPGFSVVGPDGKFTLLPGETADIVLTLSVDGGGQHNVPGTTTEKNYNTDAIENTVVDLNDAWTLEAVQQNPDGIQ